MNNVLADGGVGLTGCTAGTDRTGGALDLGAFATSPAGHQPVAPPVTTRTTVTP